MTAFLTVPVFGKGAVFNRKETVIAEQKTAHLPDAGSEKSCYSGKNPLESAAFISK
jgi:hypothetical protein